MHVLTKKIKLKKKTSVKLPTKTLATQIITVIFYEKRLFFYKVKNKS